MRSSRFTPEQVAMVLRQVESGTPVAESCRKMEITETTFYRWKRKCGGMGTTEIRERRKGREENRKRKKRGEEREREGTMRQQRLRKKW